MWGNAHKDRPELRADSQPSGPHGILLNKWHWTDGRYLRGINSDTELNRHTFALLRDIRIRWTEEVLIRRCRSIRPEIRVFGAFHGYDMARRWPMMGISPRTDKHCTHIFLQHLFGRAGWCQAESFWSSSVQVVEKSGRQDYRMWTSAWRDRPRPKSAIGRSARPVRLGRG